MLLSQLKLLLNNREEFSVFARNHMRVKQICSNARYAVNGITLSVWVLLEPRMMLSKCNLNA